MYRLAAFDMDGTLLMRNHEIGKATLDTLNQLQARNITVTFATGRHYLDMKGILTTLGINGYLITGNGTQVHDAKGNRLQGIDLSDNLVEFVLGTAWATSASMHVFRDEGWFTDRGDPGLLAAHKLSGFHFQLTEWNQLPFAGTHKICFCAPHQELISLKERLAKQIGQDADLCFSASDCLEILPRDCNKGTALSALTELLNIDITECMAFGDAMNDKEMLARVGRGIVMGNALPQLRQELPQLQVIGHCEQQAVAHYLQHWLSSPHLTYSPEF
ncbi:HMP-PP phosphatase [Yersinia ruckeri]|uniref:HMP-PP phosphatase n=1 Tax=Yersinia ruckeri TaxID=29486 RepID=UPI000BDEF13E|nr:HMP-PP phosphatase [Yersinia ruckeri]MCK8537564.1 HMP-PP phosphatase [Yersinia ruckeri]MCK8571186.1 HMP-PP phosphatase [Yersinia ruckeri]MCK8573578.1 HMP-PP phosphatase [Yersinia ruckeri]MCK8577811.1 HMP-PP phosphatase [Yersinia ruckeri]MCK8581314.1 HMP-PP phosphatase [Yersinia ruckeri]